MEALARVTAAPVTLSINGRDVILDGLGAKDFGAIEQEILRLRKDPLAVVAPHLAAIPEALAEKLLNRAYKDAKAENRVTPEEAREWIDGLTGLSFCFWYCLEKRYPGEFSKAAIFEWLEGVDEEELERLKALRDQAAAIDTAGNSTGPAQRRRRRAKRRRRRK